MIKIFKISIRTLVELIMRQGSIDNRYVGSIKAVEGIKGHQKVQGSYGEEYEAEVPLKYTFKYEDMEIELEGRADGIINENGNVVIDEIKTTSRELLMIDENFNPLHWAQAKCYGFIYCKDKNLDKIDIQITYYNIDTENTRIIRKNYTLLDLEKFINSLIDEYRNWCLYESQWSDIRNNSIKKVKFPFDEYRKGQRELAVRVYKSIENSKKCFSQAPTGIGKTISTIFPTIKAVGEGHSSKVFYLTAKSITREVAEKSINILRKQDLRLKSVTLTAKDKVCKMEETNCNPEYCPYARGYYDRINDALRDILYTCEDYSRSSIEYLSDKYMLCPFELSLELSLFSDVVICDYNYVFDPRVYLKRFFDVKSKDYTFLIDEAHNLIDRTRSMYSSILSQDKFSDIKKTYGKKDRRLLKAIKDVLLYFTEKSVDIANNNGKEIIDKESPKDLYSLLSLVLKAADEFLGKSKEENSELLDLYFDIYGFLTILEYYDEDFITIYNSNNDNIIIKLYCVNPSKIIKEKMKLSKATVIFSATLIPLNYFKEMYGFEEDDYIVNLCSPFDSNNRLLLIADKIETTYKKREKTAGEISEYIYNCIDSKVGNYMVFFPSYKYLNLIYEEMKLKYPEVNIITQENNMSEDDKEEFLLKFNENNKETHIGFCVLGGHFSEGIDLINDRLIGVIIIGVGMPQIGLDRDIIMEHMNENNMGFEYAYVYPGIIKVLQAAGRCIRTSEDKGVIMLIDSRYNLKRYYSLFPRDWKDRVIVSNKNMVKSYCENFWRNT